MTIQEVYKEYLRLWTATGTPLSPTKADYAKLRVELAKALTEHPYHFSMERAAYIVNVADKNHDVIGSDFGSVVAEVELIAQYAAKMPE